MTDLRDHLADFDAAARRRAIAIDRNTDVGRILAQLRADAGYTALSLARRLHISRSGVHKRENTAGMSTRALAEHVRPLGYHVALLPDRPGRRTTGTGWPA